MNHHSRGYSYDPAGYPSGQSSSQATTDYTPQAYHRGSYDQQGQYYAPAHAAADATQHDQYLRTMTPGISQVHQYPSGTGDPRYYQSGATASSSSHAPTQPYAPQPSYYATSYPPNPHHAQHSSIHTSQPPFIPTPASAYARQIPVPLASPTDPYTSSEYPPPPHIVPSSRSPVNRSVRISPGRPRTSSSAGASHATAASPPGERFPCEKCGKTFSRSHDRKRHHETQHLTSPVVHRCRYCEKEFSRADSLKRHLDNGCDEMPQ